MPSKKSLKTRRGTRINEAHRYCPFPLRKHAEGQENDGKTRCPCLHRWKGGSTTGAAEAQVPVRPMGGHAADQIHVTAQMSLKYKMCSEHQFVGQGVW